MTKKICVLLFCIIVAHMAAWAQRKADMRILQIRYGTSPGNMQPMTHYKTVNYDNKTEYFFEFVIKNSGPNSLLKFDTLAVYLNGNKYYTDQLVLSPGDTAVFTPQGNNLVFNIPPGKIIPRSDTLYWCDSVRITGEVINGVLLDADLSNNIFCHFVDAHYAWPTEIADVQGVHGELQLFPNPVSASLTIKYACGVQMRNTQVTLRNMLGAAVYTQAIQDAPGNLTHTADISHLPAGLYTVELHYNSRTIIQKFSVQ
ncbi:T9SS type A sorting domain-containing protein [Polluticoccus soli]|uniref:T9SS type A sorting domain-containing protein n=1 Tax=Polluticoccus soli TaxID=3034150 RepID=UPI0023E1A26A|nr:T9SS type A sorting domain-containing protein [Flavipsychrobacter sp. JY13-12]